MADIVGPARYKPGDRVRWTNEQGVDLGIRTVTQVMKADDGPQRYRISNDTPWMYVRQHQLAPGGEAGYPEFGSF